MFIVALAVFLQVWVGVNQLERLQTIISLTGANLLKINPFKV